MDQLKQEIALPATFEAGFQGTAQAFDAALGHELLLILAAVITVYIVLGVLYESYIHPITILSTLPSAGVGALLALMLTGTEFTIIALIGIVLLIGIVKKNAIMNDRLRARCPTYGAPCAGGRDIPGRVTALSTDPDDDARGAVRRLPLALGPHRL